MRLRDLRDLDLETLISSVNLDRFRNLLKDVIFRVFKVDISDDSSSFLSDIEILEGKLSEFYEKNVVVAFLILARSFYLNKLTIREFCYDEVTAEFSKIVDYIEIEE
ncbi:MAG: hypothetical protein JHC31_05550 [Sulfurihydrogenibium sp.]|jgi:hypothetical protein|nr:hypothetical protein [Sulfurihydrogenibium sp.]